MSSKRIDLYIGLGNKKTGKMEDKEAFKKRASDYFKSEGITYFFTDLIGGYAYSENKYIVEDSLQLTVIGDYSKEDIKEFADIVKLDYSQESVLVNIKEMEVNYE